MTKEENASYRGRMRVYTLQTGGVAKWQAKRKKEAKRRKEAKERLDSRG